MPSFANVLIAVEMHIHSLWSWRCSYILRWWLQATAVFDIGVYSQQQLFFFR